MFTGKKYKNIFFIFFCRTVTNMIRNFKAIREIFTPISNSESPYAILSPLDLKELQTLFRNERKIKNFNSKEIEKISAILTDFTMDNEELLGGAQNDSMTESDSGLSTYNTSQPTESDKESSQKTESDTQSENSDNEEFKKVKKIKVKKEVVVVKENPFDRMFPILFSCFLSSDLPYFSPYNFIFSMAYSPLAKTEHLVNQILKYYGKNEKNLLIFDDLDKYVFESDIAYGVTLVDVTGEIWY